MIEKVTVFITRNRSTEPELLLIAHPHAGIQIPAGTVEPDESPAQAARREAAEETSLIAFAGCRALGFREETLPANRRIIATPATVYARPARTSFDWAHLPRGIEVQVERYAPNFVQITYREADDLETPERISYQITGWVPQDVLTDLRRRHFFHFQVEEASQESWEVETDGQRWRLFWAALAELPPIVAPQAGWLEMLNGV